MAKFIDLTGQKIGKLTAIKLHPEKLRDNRTGWVCLCDCGNTCTVTQKYIKKSPAPSCGNCLLNGSKICSNCGEEKPLSEYHKNSCIRNGISSWCKICSQAWYKTNKERIRDMYLVKMADPKCKERISNIRKEIMEAPTAATIPTPDTKT